jgi:hypothetical protein
LYKNSCITNRHEYFAGFLCCDFRSNQDEGTQKLPGPKTEQNLSGHRIEQKLSGPKKEQNLSGPKTEKNLSGPKTEQ